MEILGYKYTTEKDAIDVREKIDSYYGIPILPNDITQNWTDYKKAELNLPMFYYIIFDESLTVVLGEPIIFEVTTNLF